MAMRRSHNLHTIHKAEVIEPVSYLRSLVVRAVHRQA